MCIFINGLGKHLSTSARWITVMLFFTGWTIVLWLDEVDMLN